MTAVKRTPTKDDKDDLPKLFKHIKNAIYDDGYLWIVVHGPPRSSKSTIALWIAYYIYQDWDTVLDCIVFNLTSLIHRIQNEKPCVWPTTNLLHMRVPLLLYDDFGVHSNKADTQHSVAWDIFKGGFDCIGTKLGVLLATMVDADEPTSQLQNKYNLEVTVNSKGHYKYDKVEWLQDYHGFRKKMSKTWIEDGTFDPIPMEVYKQYDVMRKSLTDEVFIRIEDALSMDSMDYILRMIKPADITFLKLIDTKGPVIYEKARKELGDKYKDTVTRCRARNLITPTQRYGARYRYDLSRLGQDILLALENKDRSTRVNIYAKDHTR